MTHGTICPPRTSTQRGCDVAIKNLLIMERWDMCREPLLKRIEQEKRGIYKRSQKPIQAVHVGSSAVQYRKVV